MKEQTRVKLWFVLFAAAWLLLLNAQFTLGALGDDLQNYWDGDGSTCVLDEAGGNANLTLIGSAGCVANGKIGQGFRVLGSDSHFINTTNLGAASGAGAGTVCGWYNTSSVAAGGKTFWNYGTNADGRARGEQRDAAALKSYRFVNDQTYTGVTLLVNTYFFGCDVYNGTASLFYYNGTNTNNYTTTLNTGALDLYFGRDKFFAGGGFNGTFDEVGVWNRTLTAAEISDLYNGGAGRDYTYISGGAGLNVITVSLSNLVNNSAWSPSVTFTGVTGTLNFSYYNITATGYCVTLTGNGTLTNCTAGSGTSVFFNVSNNSISVSGTQSVSAGTYAALLSINATQLYTSNPISTFNISNWLLRNQTTSGTLLIKANNGSNNVKIDVPGNYSLNATCTGASLTTTSCTIVGIFDDLFKINATDAINGAAVSTFTVRVTNDTLGGNIVNQSTTNGSAFIPVLQGYAYNFFMDATQYAYANVTLPANASTNTYTFTLLPTNSLFLFFYDQTTLDPIDFENVTVTFNNGTFSFSNTSNTSEMIASQLTPGLWSITADAPSYEPAQYFVTITERGTQELDVFLLNSTLSGETTITIKDADTADVIQNATVTIQIEVGGNWVTFDQQTSDLFGVTFFALTQGTQYQLIVEAENYATKAGLFVRTTSSYIVTLSSANTQNFTTYGDEFSYVLTPTKVGNNLTTFSVTTSSPTGSLQWFAVQVLLNGTVQLQNITGSPSGGTATITINLSNYTGYQVTANYYMKSGGFLEPLVISRTWRIFGFVEGNYTLSSFMNYYADDSNGFDQTSRGMIATIAAVIFGALLGFIFGTAAAVIGASLVFIIAAFYGWIHWTIIAIVVGGLVGALFLTGRGR